VNDAWAAGAHAARNARLAVAAKIRRPNAMVNFMLWFLQVKSWFIRLSRALLSKIGRETRMFGCEPRQWGAG
jgi:hypothetical protein